MRVLRPLCLSIGLIGLSAPAFAGGALPENGAAKFAAYQVCRPLAVVDMGAAGSLSSTECNGIVKNLDGQTPADNLAIHCLENTNARPDNYTYAGSCVETDADGDKLFMTYEGTKAGQIKWVGGTGKYKDVTGSGSLSVTVAPGGSATLSAYTLNYDMTWATKTK